MKTKLNIINISPKYSSIWKYGFYIFEALKNHPDLEPEFIDLWQENKVSANNIVRSLQLLRGINSFPVNKDDINLYTVPLLSRSIPKTPANCNIMMIHDLWTLHHGNPLLRGLSHYLYPKSTNADIILTNSVATQNEFESHYSKQKSIHPILLGIDDKFFNIKPPERDKQSPLTFISIGRDEPRKNLAFMLEVLAKLKSQGSKFKLLRIGNFATENQSIIEQADLAENIELFTDITEDKLISLYSESDYLLFPSLYEGFGLPVIEAMACSCIPLVTNFGSLPEVTQNKKLELPLDKVGWVATIQKLEANTALKKELISFGLEHVKQFSWANYVNQLAELITSHLKEHTRCVL